MPGQCSQQDCTVAETDICLLNNDPSTCPERLHEDDLEGTAVDEPSTAPMPPSRAYGLAEARHLITTRYVHLVGILGEPNAGKTACLASLYLLMARDKLQDFNFRDSRTLMAFEEISRGARCWNEGQLPEQLTVHTELADDRTAGFLHIRGEAVPHRAVVDLLLPDLPGEWTSALIDNHRVDRLEFLRRADAVWLMVNGAELTARQTRQVTLHRSRLLIQRLAGFLKAPPPVILVVTRRDECVGDETSITDLCAEGQDHGLNMSVVQIASVSANNEVEPGHGIPDLIRSTIRRPENEMTLWPNLQEKTTFTPPRIRAVGGLKT